MNLDLCQRTTRSFQPVSVALNIYDIFFLAFIIVRLFSHSELQNNQEKSIGTVDKVTSMLTISQ